MQLDELLIHKSFENLNEEERQFVLENLDRQQYDRLRALIVGVNADKEIKTKPSTKDQLMLQMKAKRKPIYLAILQFKVSAFAAVCLLFIMAISVYFFQPVQTVEVQKIVTIPAAPKINTVVVNQIDTIYIEKQVEVPVYITKYIPTNPKQKESPENLSNKSLADQADIRSLLVESE